MTYKFAAIIKSTSWIEGDQRSKDCPGHGYPGHSVEITELKVFESEKVMLDWVKLDGHGPCFSKDYRIIKFEDVVIEKTLSVRVKP